MKSTLYCLELNVFNKKVLKQMSVFQFVVLWFIFGIHEWTKAVNDTINQLVVASCASNVN